MNKAHQRLSAWSGFAAMVTFLGGLLIMGFFPPLSPSLTPEQVAQVYRDNTLAIRFGALLLIISGMFCGPFDAAIFMQVRRMEGKESPVCAFGQLACGIANIQFFILPGIFFEIVAFRPDRPLEVLYALNDTAWIVTMIPWTVGAMQCICIGAAITGHGNATSPYPRWLGFFNFWIALLMATSSFIAFFKAGPFAWNGIVGFWIPASVFGAWMGVMWWMTLRAIAKEEA